jgi:bla regulator protein blaR1
MTALEFWNPAWTAAVLNHLWQSTAVVGIAWVLTLALRSNPARVRYTVWMLASIKFLLPFALLVGLGSEWAKPVAGRQVGSALYTAVDEIGQPFHRAQAVAAGAVASAHRVRLVDLAPAVLAVWLCGFVTVLATWTVRWLRTARTAKAAVLLYEGREVMALRRAKQEAGLRRQIPLLLSSRAMEPGVFGVLRPVLLWPTGISEQLTDTQIEAIAAHEVEHVRRRDNFTAVIQVLVEALFWFHPVVWWMGSRLVEERERACDEKVVEQSARPEAYAESILKVCAFCLEPPAPCVSGVSGADLKERIVRIMTRRSGVGLSFARKFVLSMAAALAVAVPLGFGMLHAMQAPEPTKTDSPSPDVFPDVPKYEVATIKPSDGTSEGRIMMRLMPDGAKFEGVPVEMLLREGFRVEPDRIIGAPGWVKTKRYDVQAKVSPEDAAKVDKLSGEQRRSMLVPLLVGRFNLKYHHETRELPSYSLVIAKGGPKLKASEAADTAPNPKPDPKPGDPAGNGPPRRGMMRFMGFGHLESEGTTTEMLARALSQQLGRTVADKTGLTGNYDYTLQWTPDDAPPPMAGGQGGPPHNDNGSDAVGPSLFTALQEQLGLKLESSKGKVDVIVIDHIDMPSEN